MLVNAVVGLVGTVLMLSSKFVSSYELLIIGRFIIGYHCGECLMAFLPNIVQVRVKGWNILNCLVCIKNYEYLIF